MGLSKIIPCSFSWNPYLKTDCTSLLLLFSIKDQNTIPKKYCGWFPILFTEVKYKGNTQIIHIEETKKRHRAIKLLKNGFEIQALFDNSVVCASYTGSTADVTLLLLVYVQMILSSWISKCLIHQQAYTL